MYILEQDELPAMLRVPARVVAPTFDDTGAITAVQTAAPTPMVAAVTIDAAVVERVQMGGQDEDWDD